MDTPVETVTGEWVPLRNCIYKATLRKSLVGIKEQMQAYGISRAEAKEFCVHIEQHLALEAVESADVVCISERDLNRVGQALGELIERVLARHGGPWKRGGRGEKFNWAGELEGNAGRRKCCKCNVKTEYVFDERANCARGPCCPLLCRSLAALGGHAGSVRSCCMESPMKCLHVRNAGRRSTGRFT